MKSSVLKKMLLLGLCGLLCAGGVSTIVTLAQKKADTEMKISEGEKADTEENMYTWVTEDGKIIQMPMATLPGDFEFNGIEYTHFLESDISKEQEDLDGIVAVILRESEIEAYLEEGQGYPYIVDNSVINFDGTKRFYLCKHKEYAAEEVLILVDTKYSNCYDVYSSENFLRESQ